jgi:Mrp family chromosome partitioning ATPase
MPTPHASVAPLSSYLTPNEAAVKEARIDDLGLGTGEFPARTGPDALGSTDSYWARSQAAGAATAPGRFRPMLQVDKFAWPKACQQLQKVASAEMVQLTSGIVDVATQGHKVVAMTAYRREEGVTTFVLCAGRALAEQGLRVVIVDANLANPQLARRLGLAPEVGWEEVLCGRLPLDEVVIESTEDRLALLPVCQPVVGTDATIQEENVLASSLETLAASYDLVLVDLEPLGDPAAAGGALASGIGARLDAIAMVRNIRKTPQDRVLEIQQSLAAVGIVQAGIIENFVRE